MATHHHRAGVIRMSHGYVATCACGWLSRGHQTPESAERKAADHEVEDGEGKTVGRPCVQTRSLRRGDVMVTLSRELLTATPREVEEVFSRFGYTDVRCTDGGRKLVPLLRRRLGFSRAGGDGPEKCPPCELVRMRPRAGGQMVLGDAAYW